MHPEDSPADRFNYAVWRRAEASRTRFDTSNPPPGAAQRRLDALEAALAAARAEAALLQAQLSALEASTSWRLTGPLRQFLARTRPAPVPQSPPPPQPPVSIAQPIAYQQWIADSEAACRAALASAHPGERPIATPSLGVVLLPGPGSAAALDRLSARPPNCRVLALIGADEARPARAGVLAHTIAPGFRPFQAIALATRTLDTDLVGFLDPRDELAPQALELVAECAARQPAMDVIFADEDWRVDGQRAEPFFKPGWSLELQRGRDLLGPFTFFRTALVRDASAQDGSAWLYDLANQAAAAAGSGRILHIPAILVHRNAPAPAPAALCAAASAQLAREGIAAHVAPSERGGHRVIYQMPQQPPLVSVIVPTRDHAELLSVCADALLHRTEYQRLELLVVDNGSVERDALALLHRLSSTERVRVLRHPGPFNWAAINNRAAQQATGDVLLLLNNDTDVLQPDWLSILVSHAIQPGVGAVGPKLLYPDGRVQHAGLTVDLAGVPRHLYRFAPCTSAGSFGLMGSARDIWGVTGACLAVRRDVFFAAGGLNEALAVAYNDVDFCLRLTAHGYRIVWTPWAVLEHRELASRPPDHLSERRDQAREELDRLLRDWGGLAIYDPFLNPNLRLDQEHPCLLRNDSRREG